MEMLNEVSDILQVVIGFLGLVTIGWSIKDILKTYKAKDENWECLVRYIRKSALSYAFFGAIMLYFFIGGGLVVLGVSIIFFFVILFGILISTSQLDKE